MKQETQFVQAPIKPWVNKVFESETAFCNSFQEGL